MLKLPQIPYKMAKNQGQIVSMKSINYTDMLQDGDIVDSKNISARAYPCITTRKARERGDDYTNVEAVTVFNGKIAHIVGGKFYYDGKEVGAISNGAKKMEKINSKLVIFPDRVYFDAQDGMLHPLAAEAGGDNVVFTKNSLTLQNKATLESEGYGWYFSSANTFFANPDRTVIEMKSNLISNDRVADEAIRFDYDGDRAYFVPVRLLVTEITFTEDSPNGCFYVNGSVHGVSLPVLNTYVYVEDISTGKTYTSYFDATLVDETNSIYLLSLSENPLFIKSAFTAAVSWKCSLYEADVKSALKTERYNPSEFSYNGDGEVPTSWIENVVGGMPLYDELVVSQKNNDKWYYSSDRKYKGTFLGKVIRQGWDDPNFAEKFAVGQKILFDFSGEKEIAEITGVDERSITVATDFTIQGNVGAPCKIYSLANNGEPYDFAADFKVGDAVFVTGSSVEGNNLNFVISQIEQNTIFSEAEIFTEVEDTTVISIERRIPDLDFICESGNRIWGCSNSDNTVYASALGDPTNFYDYSGESTDSYASVVGSEGNFTAICRYGDAVLLWKENKLHKVLGSYPAEYTIYSYDVEGVEAGSEGSIAVMNETLYFKGREGFYTFSGATPQLISANFGDKRFHQAHAGVDGNSYYASVVDDEGKSYLFVYELLSNLWVLEDDIRARYFLRRASDGLYMLTEDGKIYRCDAGDTKSDMEWYLQFAPLYETIEGHKSYSRLVFRLELAHKGYVIVEVKTDGGIWREAGKVVGKREGIFPISLPINRCDKFEIRLRGKGKCKIHSIKREFYVGGDK